MFAPRSYERVSFLSGQASWSNRFVWSTYVDRANEKLGPHHDVGKHSCENASHDPGTEKPFYSLLWRELDELCSAKGNTVGDFNTGSIDDILSILSLGTFIKIYFDWRPLSTD